MATKKILYLVTQSEWGGAQKYIFDLASGLKTEFNMVIAAGEGNGDLFRALEHGNIGTIQLKHLKREISPFSDLLAFFELIRVIKAEKPDIVHLNSSKISILGSLAVKWLKLMYSRLRLHDTRYTFSDMRLIYTAHGWVFNEPLPAWKKNFYLYAEKWTAGFKDKIICVSDFDKQVALDNHIAKEDKLVTIHNGIDFDKLEFLPKDDSLQKLFQIRGQQSTSLDTRPVPSEAEGYTIIGTVANLYPTKGIEYLIEAAASVVKTDSKILFFVIGEGQIRNDLKLMINDKGLNNNFYLLGSIPDAYKYLHAFDLFVLPSVKEGLPYTVLEALNAKLPVIATNVGGIPEIIKNGHNGLLIEPKNADQLANAILKLLNDNSLQQRLVDNIDLKDFSLDAMVEKTKQSYYK